MTRRNLTVSDLMTTAIVTVRPDETVREAHADMQRGCFHHLPVLDERGRLIGMVSDRDILRALNHPKQTTIAEIMTHSPITIEADKSAHLAARIMLDRTIGSLPVVNEEGLMIGLVTQTDFLDVARRALLDLPLDGR